MPNMLKFIPAVTFGLVVAHDIRTKIKAKKNAELFLNAYVAFEEDQRSNEAKIQYLCHLLNENEIPADEFDMIVLNFDQ